LRDLKSKLKEKTTSQMKKIILLFIGVVVCTVANGQALDEELFRIPEQYTILKTKEEIVIDGQDNEAAWSKAPWTKQFNDIKTGMESGFIHPTRAKMLWDDQYLYVYALFPETDIWATLKEHDATVYQDNALEIFIDTEGTGQNYIEFQINALGTVWDLIMSKAYRNGGRPISDWDIKGLKKAVYIEGTINNSNDQDRYWSVEIAFPLKSLLLGQRKMPDVGTIWRMNLSRVQWQLLKEKGAYSRKKDDKGRVLPAEYISWSTQGIVNFHYPERWGYVQFGDENSDTNFLDPKTEEIKLALWHCYYLEQSFKTKHKRYAASISELKEEYPELNKVNLKGIEIDGSKNQFWVQHTSPTGSSFAVDHEGKAIRY
jgi:hypothetical protein